MSPKERHAHSVVQDKERHSILMACIIALIAVHILLNSASIRTPLIAQLIFGVLVGFVAFGVVAGVLDRRLPRVSVALVVFSGLMVLQVLQYPISPDAAGSKVLSDMAIMLLPLGITVVLMQWLRSSHRLLRLWLLVILVALVAALLAWLRAPTTDRFEAPSIVAIVGAWVFATVPITSGLSVRVRHWIRYSAGVAVVLLLPPRYRIGLAHCGHRVGAFGDTVLDSARSEADASAPCPSLACSRDCCARRSLRRSSH